MNIYNVFENGYLMIIKEADTTCAKNSSQYKQ